jgi:hypothetical protein
MISKNVFYKQCNINDYQLLMVWCRIDVTRNVYTVFIA